ncbi:collagen alpha-1(I) chain-like [Meles meles]|uniref:collagen alpha-1(I) chain-like n=1 Tax=Meles meles TaxID=9662 RepID=UPI001E699FDE|nr:collagen alpha-1(I) chain-like [Meles meles]
MVGRPGSGNRGGARAPGLAAGAALGGLGAPKGPVRGLAVVAGVPAQAQKKHLRVPTGWALPAGNRRDRNFGALWQRGKGPPAWTPPGGRRGGGGAAPAHPSLGQGPGDAPSARALRGGRPRGTRGGGGDTCPKTPAPPPHRNGPAPDKAPPLQAPPPPPAPGGPAWPGPAPASPSPSRLRPARGLPRPGRASPGRRCRRPGAGVRSSPPRCGRRCRYRRCRSRCRCRGLRSRRRLHRSGDIVPLNRSPRRPAPPARRRDLSATAPPRRHDGEVQAPPYNTPPPQPP